MAQKWLPWISIVPEYQRVAVFRTGRIIGYRGPGIVFRIPLLETFHPVDSRIMKLPHFCGQFTAFESSHI